MTHVQLSPIITYSQTDGDETHSFETALNFHWLRKCKFEPINQITLSVVSNGKILIFLNQSQEYHFYLFKYTNLKNPITN